jgi:hypothetical protein
LGADLGHSAVRDGAAQCFVGVLGQR